MHDRCSVSCVVWCIVRGQNSRSVLIKPVMQYVSELTSSSSDVVASASGCCRKVNAINHVCYFSALASSYSRPGLTVAQWEDWVDGSFIQFTYCLPNTGHPNNVTAKAKADKCHISLFHCLIIVYVFFCSLKNRLLPWKFACCVLLE